MKKQTTNDEKRIKRLNQCITKVLKLFEPPRDITASQWADENRILAGNAEPGPWRTSRTLYLKEPMDEFSNYLINRIIIVAPSQLGKTELILNCIGYIIDNDPCTMMLLQPTLSQVKRFSKLRVDQLINDTKCLKKRVGRAKSRVSNNTIYEKSFPGGMLIMVGTNAAGDLASTPAKIVFGDERDRHAKSAGKEGDPWELVRARQTTFKKDYKAVEVSSPTVKGDSNIVASYVEGTQALWCHKCPECGQWHEILFKDIRFEYTKDDSENKKEPTYKVDLKGWACPSCGVISSEKVMKKQPQKWIHNNPDAYKDGIVSYWIKGFAHPWREWSEICLGFLKSKNDPFKFQVFTNTVLGELWEDRGEIETEDVYLNRREFYETDLPDGVLCLTCGVDTQDDRLEYEVVGHGRFKEDWGIKKGYIIGRPDNPETWQQLDDVIDKVYKFENGRGLKISITLVDSGGHFTKEVYSACYERRNKHVFALKGKGGEYRYTDLPSKIKFQYGNQAVTSHLFIIGVDSGKCQIMSKLKVQEPGARYSHFPLNNELGYDTRFFNGLLSEHQVWKNSKWQWILLPGHKRNEPLDCRNYANAGFEILNPNLDLIEERLLKPMQSQAETSTTKRPRNKRRGRAMDNEW